VGRGKHQASLDLIEAAIDILSEIQPATVRACCYRLFVAGVIPNMSKRSTQRVSTQLTWAREHGHVPWEWIVDETREVEAVTTWNDPQEIINACRRGYRRDYWKDQPSRVEVWSEKGTVRGTLKPVLDRYAVPFRVMHGFGSATAVHQAARDSDYSGIVVLYVGDYDPSGMYMSEVDLPNRLARYDGDVGIERIALDRADTTTLPGFNLSDKRSDARHDWYARHYGDRCWELDAMSPPDLRRRVEARIIGEISDLEAWELSQKAEAAEIETLRIVSDNWRTLISGQDRK
jgi:hypothetical protein